MGVGYTPPPADLTVLAQRWTIVATKTSGPYQSGSNQEIPCDPTSASFSVLVPTAPAVGDGLLVRNIAAVTVPNVISVTNGSATFENVAAGHAATLFWDGSSWSVWQDRKSQAALDVRYNLANPALAVTYNSDGTVASTTENGTTTTFTYNSDGTVHTETRGGVTRTFTYNTDGTISGAG